MDNKDELIKRQSEIIEGAYKALQYSNDQINEIKATSQKQADEFNLHLKKLNSSGRSFLNPVNTNVKLLKVCWIKKLYLALTVRQKRVLKTKIHT